MIIKEKLSERAVGKKEGSGECFLKSEEEYQ